MSLADHEPRCLSGTTAGRLDLLLCRDVSDFPKVVRRQLANRRRAGCAQEARQHNSSSGNLEVFCNRGPRCRIREAWNRNGFPDEMSRGR